jgi:hypothetical protein
MMRVGSVLDVLEAVLVTITVYTLGHAICAMWSHCAPIHGSHAAMGKAD